jgi:L-iditol 2-dehydrogenase
LKKIFVNKGISENRYIFTIAIDKCKNMTYTGPMKRIVYYGIKDLRLENTAALPVCREEEILVKIEAFAVCGSDIKAYNVGNPKIVPPRTVGHEFVGFVEESRVPDFKKGDRITMATTIGCGVCHYCRTGRSNLCSDSKAMGFFYDGGMAEFMVVPPLAVRNGNVIPVPLDLPAAVAAVCEPMSCVMNGLSRIPAAELDYAVVIGLGALGIFHSIALRDLGVAHIVCCDFPGTKFNIAKEMGFTMITPDELTTQFKDLSGGLGFDLVVITAPSQSVQEQAPGYARKGGYVSFFASLPTANEKLTMSSRQLHYNELVYFGTADSTPVHVVKALKLLSAKRDLIQKVITVLPMEQYMEGYRGVMDMRYAKVVLTPNTANVNV